MTQVVTEIDKNAKDMGVLLHGASFAGYIFPLGNIIGPLVVWLMKKDQFAFVDECGKNCINFKISLLIYAIISTILAFVLVGFVLLFILAVVDIVCTILAMVKASDGIAYKYPMTIRFLK